MLFHRFPFVLLVAALFLVHSLSAMAASAPRYDDVAGKKDSPPRPKPKPGPREPGDEN